MVCVPPIPCSVTTTGPTGDYRLPALQPGAYTITYTLAGMQTMTRKAEVIINFDIPVDVKLGVAGVSETMTVTADQTLVSKESTEIQTGLSRKQIEQLPISQDYKDIQKLIPGVMVTQDEFRGPSGGGSGHRRAHQVGACARSLAADEIAVRRRRAALARRRTTSRRSA